MRYTGQGHEVTVELPGSSLVSEDADRLTDLFRKEYGRLYGREGPDVPLETITWRLEVSSPRPEIRLDGGESGTDDPGKAEKGKREIYLPEEGGFATVPVYDRYRLGPGATFEGPAVVEERESKVVLGPEGRAEVDDARDLVVRWPV
jgi:N-methylhydantoinase A